MAVDDLYIPDGVFLKCDQGATITNLQVNFKKHKLYGEIIATEIDNLPITNIPCFGACSSSGSACIPKTPEWKNIHEGGTKVEGQKPLLITSYCKCMQGGNIDIFFDEESALAELESDKENRVDKNMWIDAPLGFIMNPFAKITGSDYSDMGRGLRQGGKKSWNGIVQLVSHPIETTKGLGKLVGTGIIGYMPPMTSEFPSAYEIEMQQQWMNTTAEERIAAFDKDMGTDLTSTHEGIKKAGSEFWDRKIENGTQVERDVLAGEAVEFISELVVGTKGVGAVTKAAKGSALAANISERTAAAIAAINKFVQASKLGKLAKSIKGIFKVGRRLKIRGVTFEDFLASCKFPTDELANKAWDLFCKKDWKGLEKLFNDNKLNEWGGLIYPPNSGFIRKYSTVLKPPSKIDRYGGKIENGIFKDTGKYFADGGASFEGRALDASTLTNGSHYKVYEIVKPIKVEAGEAIPWFGQPGKGTQYFIKDGVEELVKKGYIKEVIQ